MKVSLKKLMVVALWLSGGTPVMADVARCNDQASANCAPLRQAAVAQGCISEAQANAMAAANQIPLCVGSTVMGTCKCGCFAPDTLLGVWSESLDEVSAQALYGKVQLPPLMSLTAEARLSRPEFEGRVIADKSHGQEERYLVRLEIANGRTLRVTEGHPILLSSGQMKSAREITQGDKLLDSSGRELSLSSVEREAYKGDVYNFETAGKALNQHVLVAEGILVGDLAWQNAMHEEWEGLSLRQ